MARIMDLMRRLRSWILCGVWDHGSYVVAGIMDLMVAGIMDLMWLLGSWILCSGWDHESYVVAEIIDLM